MGWSMKNMLALVFHDSLWKLGPLSSSTLQGPSSMKRPREDEHPGPYEKVDSPIALKINESTRTSIGPHYHIIRLWVASALEKVEE
jgi:hypothetical protein